MSQAQAVLAHLKAGHSITSLQAFELYHATRLSSIIYNLRKAGYNITTIQRTGVNCFGKPYHYAEYRLID